MCKIKSYVCRRKESETREKTTIKIWVLVIFGEAMMGFCDSENILNVDLDSNYISVPFLINEISKTF
jgi:hypothetical protein